MSAYRFYFNRIEDAPQVWSVDEGSHASEINVQGIVCKAELISKQKLDAEYPEPKAWMETEGKLSIERGYAVISR